MNERREIEGLSVIFGTSNMKAKVKRWKVKSTLIKPETALGSTVV